MGQDSSPGGMDPSGWTPRYSPLGGGAGTPPPGQTAGSDAATSATTRHTAPPVPPQWGPPSGGFPGPGGPGGPPTGAGAAPPALGGKPPRAGRSRARIWIAVGVVALLVVGGVAWFALSGTSSAEAAQVQLEATSTAGPSPFTAPVGQDTAGVVAPANAQGSQPGNTGGLYAQDPAKASCDTASLVNQVTADPAKAAAWAKSLGIEPSGIGGFVETLTAVSLRADTNVTAYGYGNGQFQPYPATLQAGTAVLVNSYGEPTVKCYNGDPLGPPTASNTSGTYVGVPWAGWAVERTIVVTPAPAPISQIVVVNPGTNTPGPKPMPPNPNPKPNPGAPTDPGGKLVLTGTHNYDGTVTLSDGRILGPDGTVLPPKVDVKHPDGSKTLPDGAIQEPAPPKGSGLVFNRDGTQRAAMPIIVGGKVIATVNPDGTTTPPVPGTLFRWNYDGTVTAYVPGGGAGNQVLVLKPPDGSTKSTVVVPAGGVIQPDGSIKTTGGQILNPDGTPRAEKKLPDGTVLDPQGGNTPPQNAVVDKTMKGTDGTLGSENQQAKQGQTTPGQNGTAGQPGTPGQPGAAPKCVPGTPGAADPSCAEVQKKQPEVCTPDPTTGVCPVTPAKKGQTGASTAGTSTGSGSGSGTSTSGGSGSSGTGGSGGSGSGGSGGSGSGSGSGGGGSTSGG